MLIGRDLQIYVKTTETCNLNCDHCFTSGSLGKKVFFDVNATLDFVHRIANLNSTNQVRLVLHGGEPMLAPLSDLVNFIQAAKNIEKVRSFGIQTNLAYTLTEDKLNFLNDTFMDYGLGTSWDADLRFGKIKDGEASSMLPLWESNVRTLAKAGHNLTLMVSISDYLTKNYEPKEIIDYAIDLGFQNILFERITSDGNAVINNDIFPPNKTLDQWLLKMFNQTIEHELYNKINNMLMGEIATAYVRRTHLGNRCRNCEQHLFTINADGTLSGCPNSAVEKSFGHISSPLESLLTAPARVGAICKEKVRNPICGTCPAKNICNGDCYKLPWDGDLCAAPKSIMLKMINDNKINDYEKLL